MFFINNYSVISYADERLSFFLLKLQPRSDLKGTVLSLVWLLHLGTACHILLQQLIQ